MKKTPNSRPDAKPRAKKDDNPATRSDTRPFEARRRAAREHSWRGFGRDGDGCAPASLRIRGRRPRWSAFRAEGPRPADKALDIDRRRCADFSRRPSGPCSGNESNLSNRFSGAEGLAKIIDQHGNVQRATYGKLLGGVKNTGDRVNRLAKARSSEGYMAEAKKDGRDWLLIENHCPICSAAKACTGLCANELKVFFRCSRSGGYCRARRTYHSGRSAMRLSGAGQGGISGVQSQTLLGNQKTQRDDRHRVGISVRRLRAMLSLHSA